MRTRWVGAPAPRDACPDQADNAQAMDTAPSADTQLLDFLSFVVGDLQKLWAADFEQAGRDCSPTKLVVFGGQTQTGCGPGSAATGPFYCPLDRRIHIDPGFFRELANRFQAPGDFAQAYVLAHEYGHHVQTLTGVTSQVDTATRENPDQRNAHPGADDGPTQPRDLHARNGRAARELVQARLRQRRRDRVRHILGRYLTGT